MVCLVFSNVFILQNTCQLGQSHDKYNNFDKLNDKAEIEEKRIGKN